MKRELALYATGIITICGAAVALDSVSEHREGAKIKLSPAAQKAIASVTAETGRTEAESLARVKQGPLDRSQQIVLLDKLIFFDQELSVQRNESCASRPL